MIRNPRLRRRAAILFATAVAATYACNDVGTNPIPTNPTPTNPTPAITISISETSATVARGWSSVAIGATLTGSGGFTGAGAAFALTGAPAGVLLAVSDLQTSGSVTTATVRIAVSPAVAPGTYTINLTGSGTGVSAVSVSFTLTVPVPSIAISANPTITTVAQGGSLAIGATLTGSGGFAGAGATFALTGAPAGVTFAVSNLQTGFGEIGGSVTTATVRASVAATVPLGTYAMDLTGTGTDVSPVSVPFALTVAEVGFVPQVGFTLSANPATFTQCEHCGDVTATITITRISGFTGSVALSATIGGGGAYASMKQTLNPTSTTGNSSILTVSTHVAPGNYTITITGTAPGFATQTVTVAVKVV